MRRVEKSRIEKTLIRRAAPHFLLAWLLTALCATFAMAEQMSTPSPLLLTDAERAWLAAHPVIRYGINARTEPYSSLVDGHHRGMDADVLARLGQRLGIRFELNPQPDWTEVLKMAQRRDIDLIAQIIITPERRTFLNFTTPVRHLKFGVFTRKDAPFFDDPKELAGRSVAVERDFTVHRSVQRDYPLWRLEPVETIGEAIDLTVAGETEALVGPLSVVSYFLRNRGIDDLQLRTELPYRFDLAIGVRSDWPELVSILDKALAELSTAERVSIERRWLDSDEPGFTLAQIGAVAIPALAVLGFCVAMLFARSNRRLREYEARMARLFSGHSAVMLQVDSASGAIIDANPAAIRYYGYPRRQLIGMNISTIDTMSTEDLAQLKRNASEGRITHFIASNRLADGTVRSVEVHISPVPIDGRIILFSLVHDVTEQLLAAEQLERMASYDALTELPNRRLFMDRLRQEIARGHRESTGLALLFMDLDGFKQINDTLGHEAGDQLLREIGRRLRHCVRESDTVARLGGDEFTVLLPGTDGVAAAPTVIRKLLETIAQPVPLGGTHGTVTASIGVAIFPSDGTDADTLLSKADSAMYGAKADGKNACSFASTSSAVKNHQGGPATAPTANTSS